MQQKTMYSLKWQPQATATNHSFFNLPTKSQKAKESVHSKIVTGIKTQCSTVLGDRSMHIDASKFTLKRKSKQQFDEHEMLMGNVQFSDYKEVNAKVPSVESKALKFQQS